MATDDVLPHVDSALASKVKEQIDFLVGAFFVLFLLCCGSFSIAVAAYVEHNREEADELAQCIVIGIALPSLIIAARLVADIEPNRGGVKRFQIAAFVDVCYALASSVFAMLTAVQAFNGTAPKPSERLKRTNLICTILNLVWTIVVGLVCDPLKKSLEQCVSAPNDAAAEANDQRPDGPAGQATA